MSKGVGRLQFVTGTVILHNNCEECFYFNKNTLENFWNLPIPFHGNQHTVWSQSPCSDDIASRMTCEGQVDTSPLR